MQSPAGVGNLLKLKLSKEPQEWITGYQVISYGEVARGYNVY
jgi:hypothetical protein